MNEKNINKIKIGFKKKNIKKQQTINIKIQNKNKNNQKNGKK